MLSFAASPWTSWSASPLVLAAAVGSIALFIQGWLRLRRRGRADLASIWRLALFLTGVATITLALVSPLDAAAEKYLQAAHMLQHVLVADVGVALVVLSLRGPLALFFLPRDVLAPLARSHRLRGVAGWALRPQVIVPVWLGTLLLWHVPFVYEAALRLRAVHDLQHISFVVVGLSLWVILLDPLRHGRFTVGERVGVAAMVFIAGQLLAYVLVFGYRPFYRVYAEESTRLLALSPLTDQKLAGVIMMLEQALTVGVFLFWQLTRRPVDPVGAPHGERLR